jgi:hypothetical protein
VLALPLALSQVGQAWAVERPEAPAYALDAQLDVEAHLIRATLRVSVSEADPRPRGAWWFHLAPNRFLDQDPRGPFRISDSLSFGFSYLSPVKQDPMLPVGFSEGAIRILSVQDEAGRELTTRLEDNPLVRTGFSTRDGLLQVAFAPGSSGRVVTIRFETRLPQRHWDGWSDAGVFAEEWYPRLLPFHSSEWVRDPAEPSAGRFDARVTASSRGWIVLAGAPPALQPRDTPLERPPGDSPVRTFPLIFLPHAQATTIERSGVRITSLYRAGNERVGGLLLEVAEGFLEFMEESYDLPFPKRNLTFIPSGLADGDLLAVDSAVIVPVADYKNSSVLDRVLVGRISRAIAQQWFGETVWANEDREAWLIWGLAGYLSLEFFDHLYGWDAPTHAITDWLAPRYREHYFEEPARRLGRQNQDRALPISLWNYPAAQVPRVVVHHKAPLVLRQLDYVVGEPEFPKALRDFVESHRHATATTESFREAIENSSRLDLDWYFKDWVFGSGELDVALRPVRQKETPGGWLVEVPIRRRRGGRMPVEVLIEDAKGGEHRVRWDGIDKRTKLVFILPARATRVVLDPREHLMETDRQNNYSEANVRVRPVFDWSKNREVLISLRGQAGGNAIDGNYVGLGVDVHMDADNDFHIIPGYGQKSEELIYDVGWTHHRLFHPRLTFGLRRTRIGGRDFLGASFSWSHDLPHRMSLDSTLEFRLEHVDATPSGGRSVLQSPGNVNNINLTEDFFVQPNGPTYHHLALELERSQPDFGSDFQYTLGRGSLLNGLELAHNHALELELIRGAIDGDAPVQKKFLLGDPLVLRGYPRTLALVNDQMLAARLDYRYVFLRGVYGQEVQLEKITGILFTEIGKGWDNGESPSDRRQRQDYGIGIEIELNVVRQVTFPIRVEIARPYNDPEYKNTQFILFQALAFF